MKTMTLRLAGCLLGAWLVSAPAVSAALRVLTSAGEVHGSEVAGIVSFKGIPYASPPVGPSRWKPPRPSAPWKAAIHATKFRDGCVQWDYEESRVSGSENCLFLNVWAPKGDKTRLPVMVWLHGGSFVIGSATQPPFWGDSLARRGVIVVTLGYRLGVLGFLATDELCGETGQVGCGNYGLLDMIAALEWIQENISNFGGDRHRVTLFGQSAGSQAISVLMAVPKARGLFHRAIGQSGAFFGPMDTPYGLSSSMAARRKGGTYLDNQGVKSVAELRPREAATLLDGQSWQPTIDGTLLTESPYAVFSKQKQAKIPLLIGYNSDEGVTFLHDAPSAEVFTANARRQLGPRAPEFLSLYPASTDIQAEQSQRRFIRDSSFGLEVWTWARLHARARQPTFVYYFDHSPPAYPSSSYRQGIRAIHGGEIPYVFDRLDAYAPWNWTTGDRQLANLIALYWTNFAKSGDPNDIGLTAWPSYHEQLEPVMHFTESAVLGELPDKASLMFLDSLLSPLRTRN